MKFLKRWLILGIITFILGIVLANAFFDLTWFNSRDEIPESSLIAGVVFGFIGAITSGDN